MTVTTESGGRQNAFPNETRPYMTKASLMNLIKNAERLMEDGQC